MAFTVKYHPAVKEIDLPMINVKMRERIRRAIESRLMTAPQEYGLPLRKNLVGFWKLRWEIIASFSKSKGRWFTSSPYATGGASTRM